MLSIDGAGDIEHQLIEALRQLEDIDIASLANAVQLSASQVASNVREAAAGRFCLQPQIAAWSKIQHQLAGDIALDQGRSGRLYDQAAVAIRKDVEVDQRGKVQQNLVALIAQIGGIVAQGIGCGNFSV